MNKQTPPRNSNRRALIWEQIVRCLPELEGKTPTMVLSSDLTVAVQTKNELKEGYGMKGISPIGKEWYEQAAGFCAFITDKTLNEAIAIARNPAETDVVASCTIGVEDFLMLIVKAGL